MRYSYLPKPCYEKINTTIITTITYFSPCLCVTIRRCPTTRRFHFWLLICEWELLPPQHEALPTESAQLLQAASDTNYQSMSSQWVLKPNLVPYQGTYAMAQFLTSLQILPIQLGQETGTSQPFIPRLEPSHCVWRSSLPYPPHRSSLSKHHIMHGRYTELFHTDSNALWGYLCYCRNLPW